MIVGKMIEFPFSNLNKYLAKIDIYHFALTLLKNSKKILIYCKICKSCFTKLDEISFDKGQTTNFDGLSNLNLSI